MLRGDADSDSEAPELVAFVTQMRRAYAEGPGIVPGPELLAMLTCDLPETTSDAAPLRVSETPSAPRHKKRRRVGALRSSLAGKVAVALAAGFTAMGGLATAGALPHTIQGVVADLGDLVGLHLPDPTEDLEDEEDSGHDGGDDDSADNRAGDADEASQDADDDADDAAAGVDANQYALWDAEADPSHEQAVENDDEDAEEGDQDAAAQDGGYGGADDEAVEVDDGPLLGDHDSRASGDDDGHGDDGDEDDDSDDDGDDRGDDSDNATCSAMPGAEIAVTTQPPAPMPAPACPSTSTSQGRPAWDEGEGPTTPEPLLDPGSPAQDEGEGPTTPDPPLDPGSPAQEEAARNRFQRASV